MTRYLGIVLVVLALGFASTVSAATFNVDPNASRLTFKLSGLPTVSVPHKGAGTATILGGTAPWLVAENAIWETTGFSPGTALFTGVPLISNLVIGKFNSMKQVTGPLRNPAVSMTQSRTIANPVGPGSIVGLAGYGGMDGSAQVVAGNVGFTLDLSKMGASNVATDFLSLATLAKIQLTLGPWHTGQITMTDVTTNWVSLPQRVPTTGTKSVGVAFTKDPLSTEEVKTFLRSKWKTGGGFHPTFGFGGGTASQHGFVTDWHEWTFAQTAPGVILPGGTPTTKNGTHTVNKKLPKTILKVLHTVTVKGSGINPSTYVTSNTGFITVVTPMRIDTSDKLVNAIPGVMRMKFSFVPEPGTVLLLVSGTVGLVLVGRSRMRRK